MATHQRLTGEVWGFTRWMSLGLPIIFLMLPLAYWVLSRPLAGQRLPALPRLPPISVREKRVLAVFTFTALAWVFRVEPWGGWSSWLGLNGVGDAAVAFVGLFLLLVLPNGEDGPLLAWQDAQKIPWDILLLFGGGIALAAGFEASGLSETIGRRLAFLAEAPAPLMISGLALSVTFLTEVTSNTATTALLMPVLGAAAEAAGVAPATFMFPAAVSASCAFMLPVATAPNAIIFGSKVVPSSLMARTGFVLNLCGTVVITIVCLLLL